MARAEPWLHGPFLIAPQGVLWRVMPWVSLNLEIRGSQPDSLLAHESD
jgi:hypothetical protein